MLAFAISFLFVSALFLAHVGNMEKIMFWAFITGNVLYYADGIILAFAFKDNRAFCKYICPMDVDVTDNSRKRVNGTECILCFECAKNCPVDAL